MKWNLSRLLNTAAAGVLATQMGTAMAAGRDAGQTHRGDAFRASMKTLSCANHFTIVGDRDHAKGALFDFLADNRTLDVLKQCGVTQIFLEFRAEQQKSFDDLANGVTSRRKFIETEGGHYAAWGHGRDAPLADIILRAKKRGIRIVAAQTTTAVAQLTGIMTYSEMAFGALGQLLPPPMAADLSKYLADSHSISKERADEIFKEIDRHKDTDLYRAADKFFAEADRIQAEMKAHNIQREDDVDLEKMVVAQTPANARSLIVVGDGHPRKPVIGIRDRLEGRGVAWISAAYNNDVPAYEAGGRVPDQVFRFDTGKISKDMPQKPAP